MVKENAERHALQYKEDKVKDDSTMIKLAEALSLEVVPQRIESYDISNYGADQITAGMVVAENGKFKKSDYRLFKIKTVGGKNDDYEVKGIILGYFLGNDSLHFFSYESIVNIQVVFAQYFLVFALWLSIVLF